MTKIIFLTRLFYPHIGGVEKHVWEISKRLLEEGNEVTIITEEFSVDQGMRKMDRYTGFNFTGKHEKLKILHVPVGRTDWFKKFRIWKWMWKNRQIIGEYDIIHCHDIFFWYLPFRFIFPKKRVFITFHGYEMEYPLIKKAVIVRKIGELLSFGNICVGEYLKKWYKTKPTYIIYGGIEKNSKEIEIKPLEKQIIKIAFVGRLENDTGLPLYISCLKLLKKKKIKYAFNIYGDGKLINQAKKYGISHGFIKDVNKAIIDNDIIFASSYLSVLESLNNKKFVCSVYNNPLKKDILEMTPFSKWIQITDNPEVLTNQVVDYIQNQKKYSSLLEEEYEWVRTQTWENIVLIYKKLWKA